jgi:hypothetical protein
MLHLESFKDFFKGPKTFLKRKIGYGKAPQKTEEKAPEIWYNCDLPDLEDRQIRNLLQSYLSYMPNPHLRMTTPSATCPNQTHDLYK